MWTLFLSTTFAHCIAFVYTCSSLFERHFYREHIQNKEQIKKKINYIHNPFRFFAFALPLLSIGIDFFRVKILSGLSFTVGSSFLPSMCSDPFNFKNWTVVQVSQTRQTGNQSFTIMFRFTYLIFKKSKIAM